MSYFKGADMDIGKVSNLLVWVNRCHKKPVRVNDHLLTKPETIQLIELLIKTLK